MFGAQRALDANHECIIARPGNSMQASLQKARVDPASAQVYSSVAHHRMKNNMSLLHASACRRVIAPLVLSSAALACAQTAQLTVHPEKTLHAVSPMLYGLMTEEINHSYDGGLYAELLSNHTFRGNWEGVEGWGLIRNGNARAAAAVDKANGPSAALTTSLRLTVTEASGGNEAGMSNTGYWGIPAYAQTTYNGSFYARIDGDLGPLKARLVSNDSGAVLAEATVPLKPGGWSKYDFRLKTGALTPSTHNHLELTVEHPGTLWMQLASLMPPTYHDRPNGLRVDLMEKMAAMHPHFVRLPGGNYLEGDTLADWYDWHKTIGPLVDRPGHQAPWSYWSTDGLGLLEFLEWTEDLHVEPVLAVYAGYALEARVHQAGSGSRTVCAGCGR